MSIVSCQTRVESLFIFQVAYISACAFHLEKSQVSVSFILMGGHNLKNRSRADVGDAKIEVPRFFTSKSNISSAKILIAYVDFSNASSDWNGICWKRKSFFQKWFSSDGVLLLKVWSQS